MSLCENTHLSLTYGDWLSLQVQGFVHSNWCQRPPRNFCTVASWSKREMIMLVHSPVVLGLAWQMLDRVHCHLGVGSNRIESWEVSWSDGYRLLSSWGSKVNVRCVLEVERHAIRWCTCDLPLVYYRLECRTCRHMAMSMTVCSIRWLWVESLTEILYPLRNQGGTVEGPNDECIYMYMSD